VRPSFADNRAKVLIDLQATLKALKKAKAIGLRIEASQRRTDKRDWVMHRRERTRHLIELGGLVQKAGLVELTDDDRATLYGAFLTVAAKLRGDERDNALALWQRLGKRAFADASE
jgi:hypothetical protein